MAGARPGPAHLRSRSTGRNSQSTGKLIVLVLLASLLLTAAVEIVAASRYWARVRVTASDAIGINPLDTSLDFGDLPKGTAQTRVVTVENRGSRQAYIVVWTLGGIAQLIKVDHDRFILNPKKTVKISFRLTVPPSAPVKTYRGVVLVFRLPYVRL